MSQKVDDKFYFAQVRFYSWEHDVTQDPLRDRGNVFLASEDSDFTPVSLKVLVEHLSGEFGIGPMELGDEAGQMCKFGIMLYQHGDFFGRMLYFKLLPTHFSLWDHKALFESVIDRLLFLGIAVKYCDAPVPLGYKFVA